MKWPLRADEEDIDQRIYGAVSNIRNSLYFPYSGQVPIMAEWRDAMRDRSREENLWL